MDPGLRRDSGERGLRETARTFAPVTRAVDDELCAFVAAGLFNIYSAANPHLGPFPYAAPAGSIFATAHGVAMSVQGNAGYAISPTVAHPLRQAILASPTYTFLHAHPSHSYANNGLSL